MREQFWSKGFSEIDGVGILVMLNNFFHDLAVALLLCSLLIAYIVSAGAAGQGTAVQEFVKVAVGRFSVVTKLSLGWVLVGGVVRTVTYKDFEWMAAAGNGQVAALIVKHILLGSLVIFSFALIMRQRSRIPDRDKVN